jgi:hypothetical protein
MFLDITIVLFYLQHYPVYISKYNVSDTGFCPRLQVKPTQMGTIDKGTKCNVLHMVKMNYEYTVLVDKS